MHTTVREYGRADNNEVAGLTTRGTPHRSIHNGEAFHAILAIGAIRSNEVSMMWTGSQIWSTNSNISADVVRFFWILLTPSHNTEFGFGGFARRDDDRSYVLSCSQTTRQSCSQKIIKLRVHDNNKNLKFFFDAIRYQFVNHHDMDTPSRCL
jgi:hypothetical protein